MKKTAAKPSLKTVAKPAQPLAKKVSTPGKFVYKPITSIITMCKCGNKYVSTRKGQKTCLSCMFNR